MPRVYRLARRRSARSMHSRVSLLNATCHARFCLPSCFHWFRWLIEPRPVQALRRQRAQACRSRHLRCRGPAVSSLVAGMTLVVVGVETVAGSTVWVLERASDGTREPHLHRQGRRQRPPTAVGAVVTVSAVGTRAPCCPSPAGHRLRAQQRSARPCCITKLSRWARPRGGPAGCHSRPTPADPAKRPAKHRPGRAGAGGWRAPPRRLTPAAPRRAAGARARPRAAYGLRWSHFGLVYRDEAAGAWRVLQSSTTAAPPTPPSTARAWASSF